MTKIMALLWFCISFNVINTNAGELNVLHSPVSLRFSESTNTMESFLKDIICACLGLAVDENSEWKGLHVTDPFNTPEAVVDVYVDGVSSLNLIDPRIKTYPLVVDEYEQDLYEAIHEKIKHKFPKGGNNLVNMKLSEDKELTTRNFLTVFGDIKFARVTRLSLTHLNYSVKEDHQFLNELAPLKAIATKVWAGAVIKPDNILDFYNFRFSSLHALTKYHGPFSLQTEEAKNLLYEALEELTKAFVKAYDGSVLVTTIVTDTPHKRPIRAANTTDNPVVKIGDDTPGGTTIPETTIGTPSATTIAIPDSSETRASDEFNPDYPAIFNIMLWFGVTFFFVTVSVVYAMMDMDPGRDSVIYRMTTARVKKDN